MSELDNLMNSISDDDYPEAKKYVENINVYSMTDRKLFEAYERAKALAGGNTKYADMLQRKGAIIRGRREATGYNIKKFQDVLDIPRDRINYPNHALPKFKGVDEHGFVVDGGFFSYVSWSKMIEVTTDFTGLDIDMDETHILISDAKNNGEILLSMYKYQGKWFVDTRYFEESEYMGKPMSSNEIGRINYVMEFMFNNPDIVFDRAIFICTMVRSITNMCDDSFNDLYDMYDTIRRTYYLKVPEDCVAVRSLSKHVLSETRLLGPTVDRMSLFIFDDTMCSVCMYDEGTQAYPRADCDTSLGRVVEEQSVIDEVAKHISQPIFQFLDVINKDAPCSLRWNAMILNVLSYLIRFRNQNLISYDDKMFRMYNIKNFRTACYDILMYKGAKTMADVYSEVAANIESDNMIRPVLGIREDGIYNISHGDKTPETSKQNKDSNLSKSMSALDILLSNRDATSNSGGK